MIEQLGPRRFRLRVQWREPKTGKKRSRTEEFEGTELAAKRQLEKLRSAAKESGGKPKRQSLAAFARSWMLLRTPRLKPSVLVRYASALDNHILPILGDHLLDKLDRSDVQNYVAGRVASGAQGNTVLNELRLLRVMAREAHADGLCARNWADKIKAPAVRRWTEERPNLLSAAQLGQLLAVVPRRWLGLVTLSAFTGLRWGEVSALRWSDVDTEAGSIKVRRSNWRGRAVDVKTEGSKRTVPLPPPSPICWAGRGRFARTPSCSRTRRASSTAGSRSSR
jgi:integrase